VTVVAVQDATAEVHRANAAVATVRVAPNAATGAVPVHRKAVRNAAATGPVAKGLDAGAVHVTSAINNANAANRLYHCRRLALRCFRTTKVSNH
jgi:hypothetical protein